MDVASVRYSNSFTHFKKANDSIDVDKIDGTETPFNLVCHVSFGSGKITVSLISMKYSIPFLTKYKKVEDNTKLDTTDRTEFSSKFMV